MKKSSSTNSSQQGCELGSEINLLADSMPSKYILVSLPLRIFDSSDKKAALASLEATINLDNASSIASFPVPEFKIGTLDALVQQADDLAKLESACASVVSKVTESMRSILDGDESKLVQQQVVNDSTLHASQSSN